MARPPISEEEFEARVQTKSPNLELVSGYTGMFYPIKVRCTECRSRWNEREAVSLLRGSNRCPTCHGRRRNGGTGSNSGIRLQQQAEETYRKYVRKHTKLSLIGPYLGTNEPTEHRCAKGHVFKRTPHFVLRRHKDRCPICHFKKRGRHSSIAVKWLDDVAKKRGIHIRHGANEGEFCIHLPNGRWIFVDGYCSETNTVYEFHGDAYHGNPAVYDSKDKPFKNKTAGQLYKATKRRERIIKALGYRLVVMWELDYKVILARRARRRLSHLTV